MKYFLPFLIGFIITTTLSSQTLVKENNHWSNLIEDWLPGTYSFHFQKIQGDTVLDAKQYKKLWGTANTLQTGWNYEAALRESNPGKVYIRYAGSNTEHLLYDFNITINDTFTGFYGEVEYKMVVDSIANVMLMNGEIRKQYFFTGITGFYGYENWIQEIGSDNGLTCSGVYYCVTDYYPSLNCFTENGTVKVYNNNFFPCYSQVGSEEYLPNLKTQVVPNPVVDFATLRIEESLWNHLTLNICNSAGQVVRNYHSEKNEPFIISREGLPGGYYTYILFSESEKLSVGNFVIQ